MSGLPVPLSKPGASRLPAPKSKLTSNSLSQTGAKRPRGQSVDLEEGLAKRKKNENEFARPGTNASRLTKPLPNSMITGRATTATFSKPGISRSNTATTGMAGISRRPLTNGANLANKMADKTNAKNANRAPTAAKSKKRAPWDLKGRLEDMESMMNATNNKVASLEAQNTDLKVNVQQKETVVTENSKELSSLKDENDVLNKQIENYKKETLEIREEYEEKNRKMKREIDDLEFSKSSLERKLKSVESDLTSKVEEITGLKTSVAQLTSSSAGMEAELKQTKQILSDAQNKIVDLTKLSNDQADKIKIFEENERAFETERRKLHNSIQELKGNIRVFCRIRPLLPYDGATSEIKHIDVLNDKSLALVRTAESPTDSIASGLKGKNGRYEFEFDRVFNPTSDQSKVFEEISQLVQSAIDGYNVCVFAYGQTGSGKTFTMEGGQREGQEGMIPRTIEQIFEETQRLREKGWTYKLEANFLEIYNEEIRDLLATEKNLKYDIKMVKEGDQIVSVVTNIKSEEVTNSAQIDKLLQTARKNRSVAATNCNERSSRSHSVFQLRITGSNEFTTETCSGLLNLVDLAGSERLKESGSEGARLTETKNINKSLANLGNVIMALAQKDSHIPYRNSKLTHLLQGSLGGNSKTLMFVNVSPKEEFFSETLNSLRFATKVNQCHIGTATKKTK